MIAAAGRRAARLSAVASLEFGVAFSLGLYAYPGAGFVPYLIDPRRSDFAKYYRDALIALTHGWSQMYDPGLFAATTREVGVISTDPLSTTALSMPQLTWLVAAVAWLPLPAAYALWLVLLGGCLAAACWTLAPDETRWLQIPLLVGFAPALMAWGSGQSVTLVIGGLAVAAVLLRRRLGLAAGIVLGLASVKPQLLVGMPLCLLFVGRWRMVASWGATLVVVLAIQIALVGPSGFLGWIQRLLSASANPGTWQVTTSVAPTLLVPSGPIRSLVQLTVLLAAAWLAYSRRNDLNTVIAIGLIASMLVTPYVHYPDLTVLLVAGWLILRDHPRTWERWVLAMGFSQAVLAATLLPQCLPLLELAYLAGRPAGRLVGKIRSRVARTDVKGATATPV